MIRNKSAQGKPTRLPNFKPLTRPEARKRDVFPVLELPPELRLQIYEYALPKPEGYGNVMRNRCVKSGVRCSQEEKKKGRCPEGFVALMTTNRIVYHETLKVLYSSRLHNNSTMVQMDVGDNYIRIRGYEIFCAKHHVFDKDIEGTFSHMRRVELRVHAFCNPYPDDDEYGDEPDNELRLERRKCLRGNLRWVASQLRQVKSLSSMVIRQVDWEFNEWHNCDPYDLFKELDFILKPLRVITSLEKVEFGEPGASFHCNGLFCCECYLECDDEDRGAFNVCKDFERRLKKRMTSKKLVKEEPELFSLYDDFVHKLKKCDLSGTNIDTEGLFSKALDFRDEGKVKAFSLLMDKFANKFQDEVEQRLELYDEIESVVDKANVIQGLVPEPAESSSRSASPLLAEEEEPRADIEGEWDWESRSADEWGLDGSASD